MSGTAEVGEWPEDWLRLNAVCPYYTMFPLDFPLGQLKLYPDARRVLDPFCGRGTTLYAARLAGRHAVGIDINPVAVAIARAKTAQASPTAVVRLARRILRELDEVDIPEGEFWKWGFLRLAVRAEGGQKGAASSGQVDRSHRPGQAA